MSYTLDAALTRIAAIQAALSISSPVALTVKQAHQDPPGTVQDEPCFINTVELTETRYGPGSQRRIYTVKMQFLCRDERAADASAIARAFQEAMIAAFNADIRLNGTCSVATLGGVGPVTGLEYAGTPYIGFEQPLVVTMHEAVAFA